MILEPEENYSILDKGNGKQVSISLPDNAELVWPFKGWDCYNLKTDRYVEPENWSLLLKIPVYKNGVEIIVNII